MTKRILMAVAVLAVSVLASSAFAQYHPDFDGKQRVEKQLTTTQARSLRSPWDPVTGQVRGSRRHARRTDQSSAGAAASSYIGETEKNLIGKRRHSRRRHGH